MGDIMNNDRGRLTIPEVSAEGVKISQEDGLDYLIHEHTSKSKYDELTRQDDPANDASLDDLTLDEICSMTSEERKSKWLEKQETIKQAREQEVNSEKYNQIAKFNAWVEENFTPIQKVYFAMMKDEISQYDMSVKTGVSKQAVSKHVQRIRVKLNTYAKGLK